MFLANVLNTFTDAWNIRNAYVASLYGFVGCSGSVFVFFFLLLSKMDPSLFWTLFIIPEQNGTFSIGVYRKTTHTDLYLPWDSNHSLSAKYSVIKTLTHRAFTICSTPTLLVKELKHLEEALGHCKYPKWAIKKVFRQQQQ